jgi:glutamyl/glutaminyl-tRNA synthetase
VEELAAKGDLTYYFVAPQYEGREVPWKETSVTETKEHLKYIKNAIIAMQEEDLSLEKLRGCIMGYATEKGRGAVLWPLRYALSGKEQSPDPFVLATILGKGETIQRLSYAEQQLQEIS